MKTKSNWLISLLIMLTTTSLFVVGGCQDRSAVLVKDSDNYLALERTGLDGEYDASGLAKRVVQAFSEDPALKDISTIYVAQNNRNIILKGRISDRTLLDKFIQVAKNIEGVEQVDGSLVEVF